jgi:uncharacterized metal-binding protein YceD (DUF177 family)
MGSRYQLSVEANLGPARFLPDSFSRESLGVNVSRRFERDGDFSLPRCSGALPVSRCDGRAAVTDFTPEFSRVIPLTRLGSAPFWQKIEATPSERERLSRRFDLLALDRLTAVVQLRRQGDELIVLEAALEAEFVQSCVVTLEPVAGSSSNSFVLVYGPAEAEQQEIGSLRDEAAFELLTGDVIDIGEAVAQELSLLLPVFPRHPDATIDSKAPVESTGSPFASLALLKQRTEC